MLQELYKIHLKDVHTDLERYLYQDCYCPGEIYDASGFFFDIYEPEDECFVLGTAIGGPNLYWHEEYQGLYVVCKEQILEFTIEEGMLIRQGEIEIDEVTEYYEYFLDEYETKEQAEEEYGISITDEEWRMQDCISRGGFDEDFSV